MKKPLFERALKILSVCFISIFIVSCSMIFKVNEPIDLLWDKTGDKTESLIIFLPGLFDSADKFKKESFFSIAREEGIKADMVAANTNIGHLGERVLIKRIEEDVFKHIESVGYKNIWMVGVSIGGLSSLVYFQKHEKDFCGLVVLAPFLADDDLLEEIKKKGGVRKWLPEAGKLKDSVDEQMESIWLWLGAKKDTSNIYLGYGKHDRYIAGSRLLEGLLEKNNVIKVKGKHDWKTGRKIWREQLASRAKTGFLQPCHN